MGSTRLVTPTLPPVAAHRPIKGAKHAQSFVTEEPATEGEAKVSSHGNPAEYVRSATKKKDTWPVSQHHGEIEREHEQHPRPRAHSGRVSVFGAYNLQSHQRGLVSIPRPAHIAISHPPPSGGPPACDPCLLKLPNKRET